MTRDEADSQTSTPAFVSAPAPVPGPGPGPGPGSGNGGVGDSGGAGGIGPPVRAPWKALFGAAAGAATAVALVAWPIFASMRPQGVGGILPGWGAVVGAFGVGTVALRPWVARPIDRLLMVWLGARGICFLSVLALGTLLYFAPSSRPDPLAMGLVLAASYFAALLAESTVMSRRLRAPRGPSTDSGPTRASV